jgi:hypothetical protein
MKKAIAAIILTVTLFTFSQAQSVSELYKMKNVKEADMVLKALNLELSLDGDLFNRVRDLLYTSAKFQTDFFNSEKAKDAETVKVAMFRQTTHIENSLKGILGEEKFKAYQQKKAEIEKKADEFRKMN